MSTWRWSGLLLVGLLAYAVFLAATVPAALIWSRVGDDLPVRAYGIEGTLWSGSAAALIEGPRRLDAVRWQLSPGSLLTLSPHLDLAAELPDGWGEGQLEFGDSETLTLRDVRARTGIATVLEWIERGELRGLVQGRVELIMPEGVIRGGLLQRGDGLLTLEELAVGPGGSFHLGTLALRLQPAEGGGTQGRLASPEGPFQVEGSLSLASDGDFRLRATVTPRDPEDQQARRTAASLGFANPGGTTVFEASGNVDGRNLRLDQRPVD